MLNLFSDPVLFTAAISGICGLVGGICLSALFRSRIGITSKFGRLAGRRSKSSVPTEEAQAVTELEVLEALGELGLSSQSLQTFRDRIQTVAELKTVIAQLQSNASRYVQVHMLDLAREYMIAKCPRHSSTYGAELLLAKMTIIAQFGAPQVVHPAFASIANHLHALYRTPLWNSLAETMRAQIADIEKKTIQDGHWVKRNIAQQVQGRQYPGFRVADDYAVKYGLVCSWDVIEPNEKGTMILNRCTTYDDIGAVISNHSMLSYDHCGAENERQFWLALAGNQVERFVKPSDRTNVSFNIHGNLMAWSRFLEALQAIEPAPSLSSTVPSKSIANQPVAEVPVVILEELALRNSS